MQQEDPSSVAGSRRISGMSNLFPSLSQSQTQQPSSSISDFTSPLSYSSIFFNPPPASTGYSSSAAAASEYSTPTGMTSAPAAMSNLLSTKADLSLLVLEHQDLLSRHKNCLTHLQKTFRDAETLRQENTNLRVANRDLSDRLNLLIQATLENHYASSTVATTPNWPASSSSNEVYTSCAAATTAITNSVAPTSMSSVMEQFNGLCLGEKRTRGRTNGPSALWDGSDSPTSVIENDRVEKDVNRVTLPKSISVRSNGFLKGGQANPTGSTSSLSGPIRPTSRNRPLPVDGPHKVYVRGGEDKKDGPIELEVYNQGMFKTELCNKWQETRSCPYGEDCQFAHGIGELRPILRHPRYKTEVCRMVLAGDPCPYGHRCHFRHALTEQEKLMVPLKLD